METKQKPDVLVDVKFSISKDGRWFIVRKTETIIKPVNYIKAVLNQDMQEVAAKASEVLQALPTKEDSK